MTVKIELHSLASRAAVLITAVFCAAVFIGLATTHFVASVMADSQVRIDTATIEAAADYFPNSAWVQARMAARLIESRVDAGRSHERAAERAVYYASRAVSLAPRNYEFRVLLAAARDLDGNPAEAEAELRAALALAPRHVEVHWRLANLLLREEKLDQALVEFRAVTEADPGRLTATLALVWQASDGNPDGNMDALRAVTASDPKSQLALARFLAQQEQADAAADIVSGLDRRSLLDLPESAQFLDALISAGRVERANRLWLGLFGDGRELLIWNGSFETPARTGFAQFDWNLSQTRYAKIGITTGNARTGWRSLKVAYQGVETTKLDGEIRQLISVRPGARYRLVCYARAENLLTPDGPQVVVTLPDNKTTLAASDRVAAGSYDWQPLTVDFVAPADARSLIVSVKQTPRFSYAEPTRGTVWFDDFDLTEQ